MSRPWWERLDDVEDFALLRSRLLNNVILMMAIVAIPGGVLSLLRALDMGFQPFMLVQVLITLSVWAIFGLRHRLGFGLRVGLFCSLLFCAAFTATLQLGPAADGRFFLVFVILLLGLLVSARAAVIGVIASFLGMAVLGTYAVTVGLNLVVDYPHYVRQPTTWFTLAYSLAMYGGVIAYTAAMLLQHLHQSSRALRQQQALGAVILRVQSQFIQESDRQQAFDALLSDILMLTKSRFGFVGEVLFDPDGVPYLKTYAITDISWSAETRAFYETHAPAGMEFRNSATLFGAALTSGQPVISNNPSTDPRSGGVPEGHPPLTAFLGIPVYSDKQLVAMLGLANRPRGYDESLVTFLQPFLATLAQLVEALRAKARFQHTAELLEKTNYAARIGTWELDLATMALSWSRVAREIHEVDADYPIDMDSSLAFYPDSTSRDTLRRVIDGAVKHNLPFDIELPIVTALDNQRWLRSIGLPIAAGGRCERIYGMFQDISELKQAQMLQEDALSDQQQSLRLTALQAAMVLDPAIQSSEPEQAWRRLTRGIAEALSVKRASVWMFALDGSELVCMDLYESAEDRHSHGSQLTRSQYPSYFHSLSAQPVLAAHDARVNPALSEFGGYLKSLGIGAMLDAVINSDRGMLGVVCAEHVGSSRVWSSSEQSFMSSISVLAASVIAQQQRQIAAVGLRESERRLRDLIQDVPGAAYRCLLDSAWTMQYVSDAIELVTGYPSTDFVFNAVRSYGSVILEEDSQRVESEVVAAVEEHRSWEIEYRIVHRDGLVRWVYEKGHALYSDSGDVLSLAGFIHDITENKRAQRMKNEFVSVVSHELRTPLTSITGALGLMASGAIAPVPPQLAQLLGIAKKNSEHLGRLINDLLDMEKLVAGQMQLVLSRQPLLALVEQAIDSNRTYGIERGVGIVLLGTPALAFVRVDGQRLLQVLSNLLSNAIKFSPDGAMVEVSVQSQGALVRTAIRDHGSGIPDEFRGRIFEKFSQADASDTRQKGGTGLGLAITREFVERMGGQIGFDSVPGEGACFFFDLPQIDDANEPVDDK